MESGRIQAAKSPLNFFKIFNVWIARLSRKPRVHDYTHLTPGINYVFESIGQGDSGCMTGYGKGIKVGDRLLLCPKGETVECQVEEISYYSDPPDMWMATLTEIQPTKHLC